MIFVVFCQLLVYNGSYNTDGWTDNVYNTQNSNEIILLNTKDFEKIEM